MIPSGCTSLVQPLDIVINTLLKKKFEEFAEQHYEVNLDEWINDRYTASERRILMTKWIADA